MQASADQYVRITELCKVSQKSTTQNLIIYIVLPGQPSLLLIQVSIKNITSIHIKYGYDFYNPAVCEFICCWRQ